MANVFYICGMIENWGRGTLNMIEECKRAKVPIPIFESDGKTFDIIIPLKEPTQTIIYEKSEQVLSQKLTERQRKILETLKLGPLSRPEIMTKLKTKFTERTIQLELAQLNKLKLIKSQGKTKSLIWSLV